MQGGAQQEDSALEFTRPSCELRQDIGWGRLDVGVKDPALQTSIPRRPALPSGQDGSPPVGTAVSAAGIQPHVGARVRLGSRAGAYLGSVCSGRLDGTAPRSGLGKGRLWAEASLGRRAQCADPGNRRHFFSRQRAPRSSGWAAPGSWLELQVLRSFPRPAVQNLHFNKIFG